VFSLVPPRGFPRHLIKLDPVLKYRLIPNFDGYLDSYEYDVSVRTNAEGFRDRSWDPVAADKTFRVLVLGDSFTFGMGVEQNETYTWLIEQKLNLYTATTVINVGVGGWGTAHEYALLRDEALARYHPNAILVGYFIGNDLGDNLRFDTDAYSEYDGLLFQGSLTRAKQLRASAAKYCNTCRLLSSMWTLLNQADVVVNDLEHGDVNSRQFSAKDDPEKTLAWDKTVATLEAMKSLADSRHIPLYVALIPHKLQLQPMPPVTFDRNLPAKTLKSRTDLRYIDLLNEGLDSTAYYFIKDGHWNKRGHAIAAQIIADTFVKDGVVPHKL